jgi:hypothetical protein
LRAWERLDALGLADAHRKRVELSAAIEDRRLQVAARESVTIEDLFANRCERSNGHPAGWLKATALTPERELKARAWLEEHTPEALDAVG